jgi:hypothetical protein
MLGIYVSDHPLREIADAVRQAADYSLGDIDERWTARTDGLPAFWQRDAEANEEGR